MLRGAAVVRSLIEKVQVRGAGWTDVGADANNSGASSGVRFKAYSLDRTRAWTRFSIGALGSA